EAYVHSKATNSRGGGTIEPQIKLQWFVDVKKPVVEWKGQRMSLKEVMHDVVHHGDVKIIPDRFEKTYFSWIDNLRDWCVSRQIWWGHRVPVFYCTKCKNEDGTPLDWCYVGAEPITKHELCGSPVTQDPDTLDTWFSSALWTWSTLIDPKLTRDYELSLKDMLARSPDFQKFHPTNVMETGYDLIFFWVARMILMTTYATGQVPFKTVYFHGLVRTKEGKKMSKSDPKTMIDPLDIIPKYGADALRLSMLVGQGPGADSKLYEEKIAGYRNFVNKLWNASRFVLMECEKAGFDPHAEADQEAKTLADQWLMEATSKVITEVTESLEHYRLSDAGDRLYAFTWNEFCDWYLELSKGESNPALLVGTLRTLLILLHPLCPFVTERLWEDLKPAGAGALIAVEWPVAQPSAYAAEHADLQHLIEVVTAIRRLRTAQSVEPTKEISVTIVSPKYGALLEGQQAQIKRLAKVASLTFAPAAPTGETASEFLTDIEIYLSLEGLVDAEKEKAALAKEQELLEKGIAGSERKLGDETFTSKAPEKVVNFERQKLGEMQEKLTKIRDRLAQLG
ncbi:MAG: class I tRNA ligase family protein, partial [Candidatus Peribacteraceae bacterium]|nr:class I tRNA ligase family protein [Candidatus Peribacteraceae bacterium]